MSDRLGPRHAGRAWGELLLVPEVVPARVALRRALARLVAGRTLVTPLVVHGPPGVGKTLLVQGFVRDLARHPAGFAARIIAARDWPADAVDAGELAATDGLTVEDVQFLPERLMAGLEAVLDARTARRRFTAVTAARGPAELRLTARLASRLASGLVVAVPPLGAASRRVIFSAFARDRRLALTPDALDWLAARPTGGGVRAGLGDIERLSAVARGSADPLTADAARQLLTHADADPEVGPGAGAVVARVAAEFGVTPRQLLGPSRLPRTLLARQVAMTLTRECLVLSLPQVGQAFGGRDHTTVGHACRKVAALADRDPAFARLMDRLRGEFA